MKRQEVDPYDAAMAEAWAEIEDLADHDGLRPPAPDAEEPGGGFKPIFEAIDGAIEWANDNLLGRVTSVVQAARAMPYRDYLRTDHWQRFRARRLAKAGYRCEFCGAENCRLDLHHRTYERIGDELDGDVRVLCARCHGWFHPERA